jgi:hypothetical protein
MEANGEAKLREAAAAALNEQKDEPEPDGEFLGSRTAARRRFGGVR